MVSQAVLQLLVKMKDEASAGLGNLSGALGALGTAGFAVAAAGVAALGVAIVGGVGDAQEARALYASTEQTIKTMGNAAGRSAQEVVDLASSLSDAAGKSLFGDDQIQQSSNLLLTFGNIKGEAFDLATALTVDLAQALGGAPADQAMMLGKALNDPVKGMSALGKAGLTFSEEQKAVIKAMQESGDMAGAQAIILEELNKQVGGQAAAAAKAAGGMVQFKASMGETFETIGAKLLPILDKLGAWLTSPDVQAAIETLATALADGIGAAVAWLSDVAIPALMQAWTDMEPTVMDTIAFIQRDVLPILAWLADVVIAGAILQLKAMGWAWQNVLLPAIQVAIAFFVANVLPVLQTLFVALRDDLPRGIALAIQGWENMKVAVAAFKETYIDPIINGFNFVTTAIGNALLSINDFVAGVASAIIPDWLQGHSPPPLADWITAIGASAAAATPTMQRFMDRLGAGGEAARAKLETLTGAGRLAFNEYVRFAKESGDVGNDAIMDIPAEFRRLAESYASAAIGQESGWGKVQGDWAAWAGQTGGAVPDWVNTALPSGGAGGGAGGITVNVTVQGNVTSERDLILAIRDGLSRLGSQNVTIFGTP